MLGELGVTLIVTPPQFIVAVGKRNNFCASWVHWDHVPRNSFTTAVNTNVSLTRGHSMPTNSNDLGVIPLFFHEY